MSTTEAAAGPAPGRTAYQGTDRLLLGIVLSVVTFWLFAATAGTVAPDILRSLNGTTQRVSPEQMNLAVSITALFSGLFIVVMGGLADRFGRVRILYVGLAAGIVGSALVAVAAGPVALPLMLLGRAVQGLSAACVMPAGLALVKAYWQDEARQRAVSMFSIGTWGGAGVSALFGGAIASSLGWRWIFVLSIAVSVVAGLLVRGTPESKVAGDRHRGLDLVGLALFMATVLALMIVLIFGQTLGWTSPAVLALVAVAVVGLVAFVRWERAQAHPFIDFALFRNSTFTGATISNFILNASIGLLVVSQQLLQQARPEDHPEHVSAGEAGMLTIGYAVAIIAFIRVGEKLLQRFGPRKPMIWGSLVVAASCVLLLPTWVMLDQYKVLAAIAYTLFGVGLAFYATPSTDAALCSLPADQSGAGAGIYKMASSLGGAIGLAVSLAIYTGLMGNETRLLGSTVTFVGDQSNVDLRQAGLVVFLFNLLLVMGAILSIVLTVPRGGGSRDLLPVTESAAPAPQLPPDEERQAILARLATLPLEQLREAEKHTLLDELGHLDPEELRRILESRRG